MELLRTAHELVRGRGLTLWCRPICTVITERPKLGPHLGAMAAALAARLGRRPGRRQRQGQDERGDGLHRPGRGDRRDRGRHAGGPLIESLLGWVSQLPPAAVYAVLALLAAVENVVPPVPSDAAVALGRLPVAPRRHHAAGRLPGHLGCRTCSARPRSTSWPGATAAGSSPRRPAAGCWRPRSLAIIEREYLRFGVAGIFVSRFLPGIRAVVPPFAGLVGLGPVRTLVPMGIASAIWYGGITMLGAVHRRGVGAHHARSSPASTARWHHRGARCSWSAVDLVPACAVGGAARERVWHATRDALDPAAPSFLAGTEIAEGSARQAAALLVLELAYADPVLTPDERRLVAAHLREPLGPRPTGGRRLAPAPEEERRTRFADYAGRLRQAVRPRRASRAGGADVDRRVRRRRHRRARGPAHAPGRRAARPQARRAGGRARRLAGAARPMTVADVRERDRPRLLARGLSRLPRARVGAQREHRRGVSPRPAPAGRVRRVARGARSRSGRPGRCCATSSTCSRISASAPRPSAARSPPSGPTTASCVGEGRVADDPSDRLETPRRGRILPDTLTRERDRGAARRARHRRAARLARPRPAGAGVRRRAARLGALRPRRSPTCCSRRTWCGSSARAARSGWCRSAGA